MPNLHLNDVQRDRATHTVKRYTVYSIDRTVGITWEKLCVQSLQESDEEG